MVEKENYPTIPASQWWKLRTKFKQSIPPVINSGYLAAALGMTEQSAKHNILPALLSFKIIDQDGKPTNRAKQWRDDEQYPMVCEQIRQEIYPSELIHALPPPVPDRNAVGRWMANRTGLGENATWKMVSVYLLLCEANPQAAQEMNGPVIAKLPKNVGKAKPASLTKSPKVVGEETAIADEQSSMLIPKSKVAISQSVPSIHIDIQIHISADSSNTQIDQIFASMSKHLGKLIKPTDE